jgi:Spy/CpxP family protein refolding chaperone
MPARPYLSIFALAGALLGATVAAHAQTYPMPTAPAGANAAAPQAGAPGVPPHRHNRLRGVLDQLKLTPDQRTQIRSAMQSFRASRNTATPMTRQQLFASIEGTLTPAQRTQFENGMRRQRQPASPQAAPSPNS